MHTYTGNKNKIQVEACKDGIRDEQESSSKEGHYLDSISKYLKTMHQCQATIST